MGVGFQFLLFVWIAIPACLALVMNPPPSNRPSRRRPSVLVPSQVPIPHKSKATRLKGVSKGSKEQETSHQKKDGLQLIPSQVSSNSKDTKPKAAAAATRNPFTTGRNHKPRRKRTPKFQKHGNLPDFAWRAIPMEDLRQHPKVVPLPVPESIQRLEDLEEIRSFRQESWQWDAVHDGRCTTSQAVAALGFLEPETAKLLGIPKSWWRGATGPFHRLQRPALRTLEDCNRVLCNHHHEEEEPPMGTTNTTLESELEEGRIWVSSQFPFAAKYRVYIDENDRLRRKEQIIHHYAKSASFDFSVRMLWGNAQEATSLLTALNYFKDEQVLLQEVGMCGAGIQLADCENLLLGATPDGLLCYPDGKIEVLEVKNHCPFLPSRNRNSNHQHKSRFEIRHYNFGNHHGVLPHYVPQLMLEMLCVGPHCKSAVMVRQTALSGAIILRMQRDDDWIDEMLYWLKRFQIDHVDADVPPPQNLFLQSGSQEDRIRYRKFLDWTKAVESNVEVVSHVPHWKIQRATAEFGATTDLFLD